MLAIDIIGLFITIIIIGIRYPHHVLIAAIVHEIGRVLMVLMVSGKVTLIIAAGAFGTNPGIDQYNWLMGSLIKISGPLANYIFCAATGGIYLETLTNIVNPGAKLVNPFAVINLRFAFVSMLSVLWQWM